MSSSSLSLGEDFLPQPEIKIGFGLLHLMSIWSNHHPPAVAVASSCGKNESSVIPVKMRVWGLLLLVYMRWNYMAWFTLAYFIIPFKSWRQYVWTLLRSAWNKRSESPEPPPTGLTMTNFSRLSTFHVNRKALVCFL